MKNKLIYLLLFVAYTRCSNVFFEIIIPTRNNEKICVENLKSAVCQNYPHFHVTVINDCSTDKTGTLLEQFIKENNLQNKVTLIHNSKRVGALANFYNCIHKLKDDIVVVNLDGDDLLIHEEVLNRVKKEYSENNAWITYGQFIVMPSGEFGLCAKYPTMVIKNRNFRQYSWLASHLRTYKAGLFKKIHEKDLKDSNGDFLTTALDLAIMFPMLEMASKGHICVITDPLYYYFTHDDPEITSKQVTTLDKYVRLKPKYKALKYL